MRAARSLRRGVLPGLAVLALIGPAAAQASPAPVNFGPASFVDAGTNPIAVATADFNGDGRQDMVVVNTSANDVSVLLGHGDGTFAPQVTYATGASPDAIAVGDLNGDGVPDLVVVNGLDDTVSVLLGRGDGTFAAQATYPVGNTPTSVAIADLNGDGHPDLAVTNNNGGSISILYGGGDGTFGVATNLLVGFSPASVAAGDFNGDGLPDLALTNAGNNTVTVLINNGTGGFGLVHPPYPTGLTPISVAVGDFNGDGRPDLAVVNLNDSPTGTVSVYLNTGAGTFGAQTTYPVGATPRFVTVGDLNNDGTPDVAVANLADGTASVLLGQGDGTFAPQQTFSAGELPAASDQGEGPSPGGIAVGDFNGDGYPDLALSDFSGNVASVLLNAPTADADSSSLGFGVPDAVPAHTLSAPQTVTVTNNGAAPLVVSGYAFSGAQANDFLIDSDTCHAPVAAGGNCTVSVRYAPQAVGTSAATLSILTNAPTSPAITLAGTAGTLPAGPDGSASDQPGPAGPSGAAGGSGPAGPAGPTGPTGATGASGPSGAAGAAGAAGATGPAGAGGAAGPAGARGKAGRNGSVRVIVSCGYRELSQHLRCRLVMTGAKTVHGLVHARLTRGHRVVASGTVSRGRLALSGHRTLRHGAYTLTLTFRAARGHLTVTRTRIVL